MPHILIIEDEEEAARSLRHLIAEADLASVVSIDSAGDFNSARKRLFSTAYDFVFCDLLLLPKGCTINDGKLIGFLGGKKVSQPFSPADWEQFVVQEGGLHLIRSLRNTSSGATPSDTPIVVTSYFDALPGYGRIVRIVRAHPHTLLLPKFYKNPEYDDYTRDPGIYDHARLFIEHLLAMQLYEAELDTEQIRQILFERRCRRIEELQSLPSHRHDYSTLDLKFKVLTYNFELLVQFDPSGDETFDWECALNSKLYRWDFLYENWINFRNKVLLNPNVKVQFALRESNIRNSKKHYIPLTYFSSPLKLDANKVRSVLVRRCLLAYLAFFAEPPQGLLDYGWTIRNEDFQRGAMEGIEDLPGLQPSMSRKGDREILVLEWEGSEVSMEKFIDLSKGEGHLNQYVDALKEQIDKDIITYFKNQPKPYTSDHIVVSLGIGYFFNGDLTLEQSSSLNNTDITVAEAPINYRTTQVFLWPMGAGQVFECAGGEEVSAKELLRRVRVKYELAEEVSGLDLVLEKGRDGDCLLCVPVDQAGLEHWDSLVSGNDEILRKLIEHGIRIILVPSAVAGNAVPPELFSRLQEAGIHSVYTANFTQSAVPEIKVFDALLCVGTKHRMKYVGVRLQEETLVEKWAQDSKSVAEYFKSTYSKLNGEQLLGDKYSGSASVRWGRNLYMTSSRTDKLKLSWHDVACVSNYSPSKNTVEWIGERPPTSGTPWHCLIYREMPEVNAILHLHNKALTYSGALADFNTDKYEPYGTLQLGQSVVAKLKTGTDLATKAVILRGHGEVIVGHNLENCVETVKLLAERAYAIPYASQK